MRKLINRSNKTSKNRHLSQFSAKYLKYFRCRLSPSHSCLRGRAGSTTSCVSARPSWNSSARKTSSRTTLTSWTTLEKWSSSWWTSTARPRGPTIFPGERRNSEQTLCLKSSTQPTSGLRYFNLISVPFSLSKIFSPAYRCPHNRQRFSLGEKKYLLACW